MSNQGYPKLPEKYAKKNEEASKVDRDISTKFPHTGMGGGKKHLILNEYDEPKSQLTLSLTPTAKINLKRELSEEFKLPLTYVFEELSRSPELLKTIGEKLKLRERSEQIEKLRQESRQRSENIKAAKYREEARKKKKNKKRSQK